MKKFSILGILFILTAVTSCSDDFVEREARDTVSEQQLQDLASSSPEAALLLSTGVEGGNNFFLNDFNTAGNGNIHDDFGQMAINLGTDLMSNDMLMSQSHWFVNYYNYTARIQTSIRTDMIWKFYYKVIQNMNRGLVLVPADPALPEDLKFIRGRLLAMRGFAYFQLTRLYSNNEGLSVPLVTEEAVIASRQPEQVIKDQILADFNEAYELLAGYSRPSKVTINKSVTAGFLARYHLEYGNNALAATYAVEARQGFAPMNQTDLFDGFNKITNNEWMWGADINANTSTVYASFFSHMDNTSNGYAGQLEIYKLVDRRVYDAISLTDARRGWFASDENPFNLPKYAGLKFIDDTNFEGDYVFMRGAEMYLIEAEAKALSGDNAGARAALFALVSTRDASYAMSTNSGASLVNEVRTHRKIELWGEGFAFFDMKRWDEGLVRDYPGTNHNSLGLLNYPANSVKFNFQIPNSEVNTNTELGAQNPF